MAKRKANPLDNLSNVGVKGSHLVVEVNQDVYKDDRPVLPKGSRLVVLTSFRGARLCVGAKSLDPASIAWPHLSMWSLEASQVTAVGRVDCKL